MSSITLLRYANGRTIRISHEEIFSLLVTQGISYQFSTSADGPWTDNPTGATWSRWSFASLPGYYSDPIPLLRGPQGYTPEIGSDGDWYINGETTGQPSQGNSSYEDWLLAGNEGTLEQYIAWLRGQGIRIVFDNSDLVAGVLTVTVENNVVGLIDNNDANWELLDGEVTYGDGTVSIDLTRTLADLELSELPGTWQVALATGSGETGKSAFQIWLDHGNSGDESDFLADIVGETGASAYEVWLSDGNEGTESDFLNVLVGPQGSEGQSTYELWLAAGNDGTESEFLQSLYGTDGSDGEDGATGKSAYQVWLDLGNSGTETDFLNWLRKDANSYEFDSSDVVDGYLTFETNNGVAAVVDENGLQWELPQNAVVYADGEATIDLRGILAMRNVAVLPGTWSVMLVGGVDGQSWNVADTAYLYSTEYGAHRRLDDLYPSISVGAFGVIDCNAVRMRVKTASGVSGNIVIVPTVDGTAGTPVVIAVTGDYVYQTVSLPASVSGDLVLVRDMESEYDTIPDVTVIAQHISWRCVTTIGG